MLLNNNNSLNLWHLYLFYYCCYMVFFQILFLNNIAFLVNIFEDVGLATHQKWRFMLNILKGYRLDRTDATTMNL